MKLLQLKKFGPTKKQGVMVRVISNDPYHIKTYPQERPPEGFDCGLSDETLLDHVGFKYGKVIRLKGFEGEHYALVHRGFSVVPKK